MVDITPAIAAGKQMINGYGGNGFRIAGVAHEGSVIVFPGRTVAWPVTLAEDLSISTFEIILAADEHTEILLVGMGESMSLLSPALRDSLRRQGIVVDAMTTGAACRTFNILLSEERRVAAALIAVP